MAAIGYFEVYDRRGDLDLLSTGGSRGGLLRLHQPDVFLAVNRSQHIRTGEIQDDPTRTSLHGLRPRVLYPDIPGKGGGPERVLPVRHEQFQLVGLNLPGPYAF